MDLTRDLDQDITIHQMGLFSVKRYAYTECNWVDADGNTIKERVFSFILMRGPKWFNSTHLNFKESELDRVIHKYQELFAKMQQERKEKLTIERATRKQYPRKHEFVFDNVTIVAIEEPLYYEEGRQGTRGNYFEPNEKVVSFYANGFPYRSRKYVSADTIVDADFVLDSTFNNQINKHYSPCEFKENYVVETVQKMGYNYIPIILILGYVYNFDGKDIEFYDYRYMTSRGGHCFEIQGGEFMNVSLHKLMSVAKPVGELQGMAQFKALMNKANFV